MPWTQIRFDGLDAMTFEQGRWRITAVYGMGPRIAFLGDEENLLYWQKDGMVRGDWRLHGGHRVWLTRPMADESEDTYLSDNVPCAVRLDGDKLTLTAPAHPVHRLERGLTIEPVGEGRFRVTSFVTNTGGLIYSGGVWAPTCVVPDGRELRIPLGQEGTSWDLVKVVIPRVFAGNTLALDDPQVRFEENDLVVRPAGKVCKRCAWAPQGRVELRWPERGLTFAKTVKPQPFGSYPLDGCNVAVFAGEGNWMAELETYGPEQPILPGQRVEHTEFWELTV